MILVVIVNYHSQPLVCACLDQLKGLRRQDLAYFVVDNSERPDIDSIRSRHPDARLHRPGVNLGFAGGCNLGLRYAVETKCDYALLLNPDVAIDDDFIAPLVEALEGQPAAGMAGPLIFEDAAARRLWQGVGRIAWCLGGPVHRGRKPPQERRPMEVPFLSGCAMMVRVEALERTGLMDESYFLYFEDTDFCLRLIRCGWKVLLVPRSHLLHAQSSTIGRNSPLQVYCLSRNRIRLVRRWAGGLSATIFLIFNLTVKVPLMAVVFGICQRRPRLMAAYLKGLVDGWRVVAVKRPSAGNEAGGGGFCERHVLTNRVKVGKAHESLRRRCDP